MKPYKFTSLLNFVRSPCPGQPIIISVFLCIVLSLWTIQNRYLLCTRATGMNVWAIPFAIVTVDVAVRGNDGCGRLCLDSLVLTFGIGCYGKHYNGIVFDGRQL